MGDGGGLGIHDKFLGPGLIAAILDAGGLGGYEREYRFAPPRRFRADFAWVKQKVILEVDGGVWTRGRHVRPLGFLRDIEKLNLATAGGFKVFRVGDLSQLPQVLQLLKQVVGAPSE